MKDSTHLLVIDPQNDFCDLPENYLPRNPSNGQAMAPALAVPGAHADMLRLAQFVRDVGSRLDRITITLDSHHRLHIAHPGFWQRAEGGAPAPFTPITAAQVRAGHYRPRQATALPRALHYLDELEARGRYTLMIWPVHCEIGSWGHGVHADLRAAYNAWEDAGASIVAKVNKGSNPWTEHYSAIAAEVPDEDDPGTGFNQALVHDLGQADLLIIAGEASSHCVRATTKHLVLAWPAPSRPRLVLLTDCMSPVSGFQAQHESFIASMDEAGVELLSSVEMRRELLGGRENRGTS